jgi:L-ascorbate metabolism protein UlaG (beta-lactamase superfamily)
LESDGYNIPRIKILLLVFPSCLWKFSSRQMAQHHPEHGIHSPVGPESRRRIKIRMENPQYFLQGESKMKRIILPIPVIAIAAFLISGCAVPASAEPATEPVSTATVQENGTPASDLPAAVGKLHWFGTSAVLYHGSKNIYFDPVTLAGNLPPADIVLISHAHADHADLESLEKIIVPGTILILSPNVGAFYHAHAHDIGVVPIFLKEGETAEIGGVKIEAVPAYDDQIHFRSTEGAGFVVGVDGERIYFAGGTRVFPEMADIVSDVTLYPWYRNADVLAAAEILQTKVLIPVHSGESGVKAFVDVYGKDITRLKLVALVPGPYYP